MPLRLSAIRAPRITDLWAQASHQHQHCWAMALPVPSPSHGLFGGFQLRYGPPSGVYTYHPDNNVQPSEAPLASKAAVSSSQVREEPAFNARRRPHGVGAEPARAWSTAIAPALTERSNRLS
jgi:hypothetical protein